MDPASLAMLRLSVQIGTSDTSPATGLESAASKPSHSPMISVSYISAFALRENPFVPNHCPSHQLSRLFPSPLFFMPYPIVLTHLYKPPFHLDCVLLAIS